jgi:hypothetical protein
MLEQIGFVAALVLPLWNIPLILRIGRRRSSADISLPWTLGVWVCLVLMLPAGLGSPDPVFRAFSVANVVFFTGVLIQVLRFR